MREKEIIKLRLDEAKDVIETKIPNGLFYCIEKLEDKNIYIAIDNNNGHLWIEEFPDLRRCKHWLMNEIGSRYFIYRLKEDRWK